MASALIVLDMQQEFLDKKGTDLAKKIALYIKKNKEKYSRIFLTKNRSFCMSRISEELLPFLDAQATIVHKAEESVFKSPHFLYVIKKSLIDHVDLCGIDANDSVEANAKDAEKLKIEVEVLNDLILKKDE